jgi:hypothetical protein
MSRLVIKWQYPREADLFAYQKGIPRFFPIPSSTDLSLSDCPVKIHYKLVEGADPYIMHPLDEQRGVFKRGEIWHDAVARILRQIRVNPTICRQPISNFKSLLHEIASRSISSKAPYITGRELMLLENVIVNNMMTYLERKRAELPQYASDHVEFELIVLNPSVTIHGVTFPIACRIDEINFSRNMIIERTLIDPIPESKLHQAYINWLAITTLPSEIKASLPENVREPMTLNSLNNFIRSFIAYQVLDLFRNKICSGELDKNCAFFTHCVQPRNVPPPAVKRQILNLMRKLLYESTWDDLTVYRKMLLSEDQQRQSGEFLDCEVVDLRENGDEIIAYMQHENHAVFLQPNMPICIPQWSFLVGSRICGKIGKIEDWQNGVLPIVIKKAEMPFRLERGRRYKLYMYEEQLKFLIKAKQRALHKVLVKRRQIGAGSRRRVSNVIKVREAIFGSYQIIQVSAQTHFRSLGR